MKGIIILSVALNIIFLYMFGVTDFNSPTDVTKKDFSVYTPEDIIHVVDDRIFFESSDTMFYFDSDMEQYIFLENLTVHSSNIIGYTADLDNMIRDGYVYCKTVNNEDEQYTDIIYKGPIWTGDMKKDTSYIISTFNHVEKLYDPITRVEWLESYTID